MRRWYLSDIVVSCGEINVVLGQVDELGLVALVAALEVEADTVRERKLGVMALLLSRNERHHSYLKKAEIIGGNQ